MQRWGTTDRIEELPYRKRQRPEKLPFSDRERGRCQKDEIVGE